MAEIETPLIELAPGEPFIADDDGAVVITSTMTHKDILRYVVNELGAETIMHVEDILAEGESNG